MAKGKPNNKRYKYPLPIHPIDNLPQLYPHNPISWAYWLYCYYKSVNDLQFRIPVEILGSKYLHVLVKDPSGMNYLWNNGFFGTGQFSRSEPTWLERTNKRINNTSDSNEGLNLEKVTEIRRLQRADFKKERKMIEDQLLEMRQNGCSREEENTFLIQQREELRKLRDAQISDSFSLNEDTEVSALRLSDYELFDDNDELHNIEALELMPVEAIFLTFALPVLDIHPNELFEKLIQVPQHNNGKLTYKNIEKLVKKYVVYHYYRSRGWCVRSGIKFGCEYLLYKRGPPFQHAQFCIMSLDYDECKPYEWYSTLSRVTSNAKKTLVLCYIETITNEDDILKSWNEKNYKRVFQSYKISEVVYSRWMPGKNRD